jgi:hypothetical protein
VKTVDQGSACIQDVHVSETAEDRLAADVQGILDREAIADLLHGYCRYADLNDPDGIAACFTDDCVADYGPGVGAPARGAEARRAEAARDLSLFAATSHHLSNITVTFDHADRARATSVLYAWHRPRDGGSDWTLWAQYHDVVVRTRSGWRIAERRMLVAGADGFPATWGWLPVGRKPSASDQK